MVTTYFLPVATASELTVELVKRIVPFALAAWGIGSLVRRSARAPGVCVAAGIAVLLHIGSAVGVAGSLALPLSVVILALAISLLWSTSRKRAA